jgi:hypothetical protein
MTGLALLNATDVNATVDIFVMNPSGTLMGAAPGTTINGRTRISRLLSEIVPESLGKESGFIFVRSTNNVPLYGIELFFTQSLSVMSNVAAGTVVPGITFAPPAIPDPLTLTSISPGAVTAGSTVTLTGTGFNATPANNSVVFTSASGTVSATPSASTGTSMTVTVPSSAMSGPVFLQTNGQSSGSIVLTVTPATPDPDEHVVTVSGGTAVSNVDIYVPAPAGSLNVDEIGISAVNALSTSFSGSAVEVTRGQTVDLIVSGAGISAANATTLTVSGAGITLSNVRYQGGGTRMVVTMAVSAGADAGMRSIVLTNANQDVTVLTGGLFIR